MIKFLVFIAFAAFCHLYLRGLGENNENAFVVLIVLAVFGLESVIVPLVERLVSRMKESLS